MGPLKLIWLPGITWHVWYLNLFQMSSNFSKKCWDKWGSNTISYRWCLYLLTVVRKFSNWWCIHSWIISWDHFFWKPKLNMKKKIRLLVLLNMITDFTLGYIRVRCKCKEYHHKLYLIEVTQYLICPNLAACSLHYLCNISPDDWSPYWFSATVTVVPTIGLIKNMHVKPPAWGLLRVLPRSLIQNKLDNRIHICISRLHWTCVYKPSQKQSRDRWTVLKAMSGLFPLEVGNSLLPEGSQTFQSVFCWDHLEKTHLYISIQNMSFLKYDARLE